MKWLISRMDMPDFKVLEIFFEEQHRKWKLRIRSIRFCACVHCRCGKADALIRNDHVDHETSGKKGGLESRDITAEWPKCAICGLHYRDKMTAMRCEVWCGENQSCNLEITRESIERSARK